MSRPPSNYKLTSLWLKEQQSWYAHGKPLWKDIFETGLCTSNFPVGACVIVNADVLGLFLLLNRVIIY